MPCKAVNKAASLPSKVRMTIGIALRFPLPFRNGWFVHGELVVKARFGCLLWVSSDSRVFNYTHWLSSWFPKDLLSLTNSTLISHFLSNFRLFLLGNMQPWSFAFQVPQLPPPKGERGVIQVHPVAQHSGGICKFNLSWGSWGQSQSRRWLFIHSSLFNVWCSLSIHLLDPQSWSTIPGQAFSLILVSKVTTLSRTGAAPKAAAQSESEVPSVNRKLLLASCTVFAGLFLCNSCCTNLVTRHESTCQRTPSWMQLTSCLSHFFIAKITIPKASD